LGELAHQPLAFISAPKNKDAFAPFALSPGLAAIALAAYMLLVEANIRFALLLAVIAIIAFEWNSSPPQGH